MNVFRASVHAVMMLSDQRDHECTAYASLASARANNLRNLVALQ
jgi:hypothetical protein